MRSKRPAAWIALALVVPLAAAACGDGGTTPPAPKHYDIAIEGGDAQFGLAGTELAQPLQVVVSDPQTALPQKGVTVSWSVSAGDGASVDPTTSVTDSTGVASTSLTLGPSPGQYVVRADIPSGVVTPVEFDVTALAQAPTITSISPQTPSAGDTVTITGENFFGGASDLQVLFDGFSGLVVSATSTQIRAVIPPCLPGRTVQVSVAIGSVAGPATSLDVVSAGVAVLQLPVGGVISAAGEQDVACLRIDPQLSGTRFLVAIQNATAVAGASMPFHFTALAGAGVVASLAPRGGAFDLQATTALTGMARRPAPPSPQIAWEMRIRQRERNELRPQDFIRGRRPAVAGDVVAAVPSVGDQKDFQVVNKDNQFTKVSAVVKFVGAHGVIYQDVNAPANGFTTTQFQHFSELFDDPIYDTDVATYGAPSDIDGNEHVDILFTPVVNELTPKGSNGFVAGFFYGNDLSTNQGSNRGEIFYSLVPDPTGKFGDVRSTSDIFEVVPPTLAHEFMHMIHYNQRVLIRGGFGLDALWLSEGLAHTAEDVVGQVFADRGDLANADEFQSSNYARAYYYLGSFSQSPDHTYDVSLLAEDGFGSLEQRGAAWLMLKYLRGLYGDGLLKQLVQTTLSSADNISSHTGQSWQSIFNDWSVALYADNDPELSGANIPARYQFAKIDLRKTIFSSSRGGFALQPEQHGFVDFDIADTLPAASPFFLILDAGASTDPLNLNLAPRFGSKFGGDSRAQIAILRLR